MTDECCEEGWEHETADASPILAFDSRRTNNAQLIVDLVTLGYLHDGQEILDLTYGKGAFWKLWLPSLLLTNDLDESTWTDHQHDFRHLPEEWTERFDVVVFDPPYGYRGTSRLDSDKAYGLGEYLSVYERENLMQDGFREALRICKPGGLVIAKMQDQTVSGAKRHQTKLYWGWAEMWGSDQDRVLNRAPGPSFPTLLAELHVRAHRKQPEGREQKNVHQNYSTCQVWRRT